MKDLENLMMAIFTGILALAIVSVIVSKRSDAAGVIKSLSNALASVIGAATSSVGSSSTIIDTFIPGGGSFGGHGATGTW